MSKYKLGMVATEERENYSGTKTGVPVVGLEHLVPNEVILSSWDLDKENTFTKAFKKGDVLFGRRRAYLHKAAVAPVDGICSGDITVIRANSDILVPELLPFIIQNDDFFNYAVEKSAGSLSPRVKWMHLKDYELELPDLETQKRLADVLWSINDTIEAYKELISATDEVVKAEFIEQFNLSRAKDQRWPIKTVKDCVEKPMSGEWGVDDKDGSGVKVLRTTNFSDDGFVNYDDVTTRKINNKKVEKKKLLDGDIIIEKSGGSDTRPVGRVVLYQETSENYMFNNFTAVLRARKEVIKSRFLFTFLYVNYWNGGTKIFEHKTTGLHNLRLDEYLDNTFIPIPPEDIQESFANYVAKSNGAKNSLQQSLNEARAIQKKIIKENFASEKED